MANLPINGLGSFTEDAGRGALLVSFPLRWLVDCLDVSSCALRSLTFSDCVLLFFALGSRALSS